MKIYYENKLVGILENTVSDMWYIEGDWIPEQSDVGIKFDTFLRQQDLRLNLSDLKGVVIQWTEDETVSYGLGLGIEKDKFIFRMLSLEAVEILKKENKIVNL